MTNHETPVTIAVDDESSSSTSSKPVKFFGGFPGLVGIALISLFELAVAFVGTWFLWKIHDTYGQHNGAWIAIGTTVLAIPFFEAILGVYVFVTAMMKKSYKKCISVLYIVGVIGSIFWHIWIWIGLIWINNRKVNKYFKSSQEPEIDVMQLILMLVYQALHVYFNVFIGKMKDSA